MVDSRRLDLLDPAEVARFGGIEIVAQGGVEGFLSGIHRSPFRGFSVEFTEHRAYQPGDELRYLDWKILARADRLFVKQFEQETNLRAMILVRSEEHTSELQSRLHLVCRLLLEKKNEWLMSCW